MTPLDWNELGRDLSELVKVGLLKKARSKGKVVYYLSFAERAERLIKRGVEPHKAYLIAIAEHAPSLDLQDMAKLTAIYVHDAREKQKLVPT